MNAKPQPPPVPPAGWYPDSESHDGWRYWDGARWSEPPDAGQVARVAMPPTQPAGPAGKPGLSREERADLLESAVEYAIHNRFGKRIGRVDSRTDTQAVLIFGSKPNHVVHALLTIFTVGLWLPVWLLTALTQREEWVTLSIDKHGNATER